MVAMSLKASSAAPPTSSATLHPPFSCIAPRSLRFPQHTCPADLALREQAPPPCTSPSFKRVSGSSMICRAELDDSLPKLQRDRRRIEQALPDLDQLEKGALSKLLNLELESAYNLDTARHYEVMLLVHEDRIDELQDVIQKVKDFITEKKGKIWRLNDWGMRRLAYKIAKARRANYILLNIEIGAQSINDFKALLEKDERVIRFLVIKRKEAMTEDTVPPPEYFTGTDKEDLEDYDSEEELEDEDLEETEEEEEEEEETKEVILKA